MIDFPRAIEVATESAQSLIKNASNFVLEGVLLSDDGKLYEVSLSYDLQGTDPLGVTNKDDKSPRNSGLFQLAQLMRYRREHRVFFVDSDNGKFRGFKNQKIG